MQGKNVVSLEVTFRMCDVLIMKKSVYHENGGSDFQKLSIII